MNLAHARVSNGSFVAEQAQETTLTGVQGSASGISLDIKQSGERLQFGGRVSFPSGYSVERRDLSWELPENQLEPGTRLGLMTSGNGGASFTRLQVNYPGQAPVALVPAGIAQRLLARLVLKRSLLAVGGLGGAFAAPVPEPDFETWFWITPSVAGSAMATEAATGSADSSPVSASNG